MCANMQILVDGEGRETVVMSEDAFEHFDEEKKQVFRDNYRLLTPNIDTLEYVGGGSARCMIAEKF